MFTRATILSIALYVALSAAHLHTPNEREAYNTQHSATAATNGPHHGKFVKGLHSAGFNDVHIASPQGHELQHGAHSADRHGKRGLPQHQQPGAWAKGSPQTQSGAVQKAGARRLHRHHHRRAARGNAHTPQHPATAPASRLARRGLGGQQGWKRGGQDNGGGNSRSMGKAPVVSVEEVDTLKTKALAEFKQTHPQLMKGTGKGRHGRKGSEGEDRGDKDGRLGKSGRNRSGRKEKSPAHTLRKRSMPSTVSGGHRHHRHDQSFQPQPESLTSLSQHGGFGRSGNHGSAPPSVPSGDQPGYDLPTNKVSSPTPFHGQDGNSWPTGQHGGQDSQEGGQSGGESGQYGGQHRPWINRQGGQQGQGGLNELD